MTETTPTKRGVPIWVQVVIWLFLVALMVLVGTILGKRQQGTVQPGDVIPEFNLPLFSGFEYEGASSVDLSSLRGKVVVLNFWASWCKPCEQEAAELEEAWQYYQDKGVVFIGVDYVDTEPEALTFLKKYGISYSNGPDMGTRISQLFRIRGVPETYFIDQEGVLYYVKVGPLSSVNEIRSIVDQKLK